MPPLGFFRILSVKSYAPLRLFQGSMMFDTLACTVFENQPTVVVVVVVVVIVVWVFTRILSVKSYVPSMVQSIAPADYSMVEFFELFNC